MTNQMRYIGLFFLIMSSLFVSSFSFAQEAELNKKNSNINFNKSLREKKYYYDYRDRDHTFKESLRHIGGVYLASWAVYPITQPDVFREKGSIKKYRKNFGKLVFDKDEPFWNWVVHPISGSQLFLYYRANGYDRIRALSMAFISSTLFEFTVEVYTEPASVQDLYQTPVLGAVLGIGIEQLSLYLLNTGNAVGRFFGHLMNPSTLFWFYEGRIRMVPYVDNKKAAMNVSISF